MSEAPDPNHEIEQNPIGFNLDMWLLQREHNPNYVMVEIGHGHYPVAKNQEFESPRLYVGFENWQYRSDSKDAARQHTKQFRQAEGNASKNAVFISNDSPLYEKPEYGTVLPEGMADEVFLGNVIGDPHVYENYGKRIAEMLSEAVRLLSDTGKIVIRETITPNYDQYDKDEVEHQLDAAIRDLGLKKLGRISGDQSDEWLKLEQLYHTGKDARDMATPESYYLILEK